MTANLYRLFFEKVENNYKCKIYNCPKKFTRLSYNAKKHLERHFELNLPYQCIFCYMGFKRYCDLARHLSQDHTLEMLQK